MQPCKGYFIAGDALLVHPLSRDWFVGGSVYVSGPGTSILGVTRFQLQQFTVSMKELTECSTRDCADSGGRMPNLTTELNGE